jgi:hypothetical protein
MKNLIVKSPWREMHHPLQPMIQCYTMWKHWNKGIVGQFHPISTLLGKVYQSIFLFPQPNSTIGIARTWQNLIIQPTFPSPIVNNPNVKGGPPTSNPIV